MLMQFIFLSKLPKTKKIRPPITQFVTGVRSFLALELPRKFPLNLIKNFPSILAVIVLNTSREFNFKLMNLKVLFAFFFSLSQMYAFVISTNNFFLLEAFIIITAHSSWTIIYPLHNTQQLEKKMCIKIYLIIARLQFKAVKEGF